MPDTDAVCAYIQSFLSRNLGMAGEHCTIPNNMVMTSQIQSACPKTCCQCQGNLRCEHFIEITQIPAARGQPLGRNAAAPAAAGLLPNNRGKSLLKSWIIESNQSKNVAVQLLSLTDSPP